MKQLYVFTPRDIAYSVRALSEIGYHEGRPDGYLQNGNPDIRISRPVQPDARKLFAIGVQTDEEAAGLRACMEFLDASLGRSLSPAGQSVLECLLEKLGSAAVYDAMGNAFQVQ